MTAGDGDCAPVTEAAAAPGSTLRLECPLLGAVAGHTWVTDLVDPGDGAVVARAAAPP